MNAMHATHHALDDPSGDAQSVARAVLNILDDFGDERSRGADTQRAVLNILDDFGDERTRSADTQRAVLNILDDFGIEMIRLAATQRAILNVLDDSAGELSERVKAEQALRHAKNAAESASRELEAFSYSVAHDLRAPLRGIDGFSQALVKEYRERLDDTGIDYLHRIRNAAQRMSQLIDDLLRLSQVGRTAIARESVDLSTMANALLADLQQQEPARQVGVVIAPGLRVHADPHLMQVVLTNLLSNAWKFTAPQSEARIEVGLDAQRGEAAMFVRDNGVGFDMEYAGKLFGAFQRLHAMHEFAGTGVGLATVKRIIERHGGRIWADAAPDRGATFYFTLGGDSHDDQANDPAG